MKHNVYASILTKVASDKSSLYHLAAEEHTPLDTLISIWSQKETTRVRADMPRQRRRIKDFVQQFANGKRIDVIAEEAHFPPYLMAKLIVSSEYKDIKRPLQNPSAIPDQRLREEVAYCVEIDDMYSSSTDRIRKAVGQEKERELQDFLRNRGVLFETEEDLRRQGVPKTPDVLLSVPLILRGNPVFWIDSKATFGEPVVHKANLEGQFTQYVNLFGPGAVFYWFDFDEDIVEQSADVGVLVLKDLSDIDVEPFY